MELHNTVEDLVISMVDEIFGDLVNNGNKGNFCTCNQCRMDVICYVLNRATPYYIMSSRGASRVQNEDFDHQQQSADIAALVHEGLKRVNCNQRPYFDHHYAESTADSDSKRPVYNVPTIMGRIFNGNNFAPLSDVCVELLWNGALVPMKDNNWQNPYHIVSKNEGNFSFWPAADIASGVNKHKIFEYILRVTAEGFETVNHIFKIPVASEIHAAGSFTLSRTFKLPDLYMFSPGEAEKNGYLD